MLSLLVAGLQVIAVVAPAAVAPAGATIATGSGGEFVPVTGRLMDTSTGVGGYNTPMVANGWRTLTVANALTGLPSSGMSAVQLTLTAWDPTSQGSVRVVPDGASSPGTAPSVLCYGSGSDPGTTSNTTVVAVPSDGKIQVQASTSIRMIIDVQGYFTAGNAAAGGYVPVTPKRIVDTRSGLGLPQAKIQ